MEADESYRNVYVDWPRVFPNRPDGRMRESAITLATEYHLSAGDSVSELLR